MMIDWFICNVQFRIIYIIYYINYTYLLNLVYNLNLLMMFLKGTQFCLGLVLVL